MLSFSCNGRVGVDTRGHRRGVGLENFVEGIAAGRGEAGAADDGFDFFRRGGAVVAGFLEHVFFHQDAAEVVGAGNRPSWPAVTFSLNEEDWIGSKLSSTSHAKAMRGCFPILQQQG